ncbi:MAG: hypothetical protein ACOC4G_06650 [Bacillota bacterium]
MYSGIQSSQVPQKIKNILRKKGWREIKVSSLTSEENSPLKKGIKTRTDGPRFDYFLKGYESAVEESLNPEKKEKSKFKIIVENKRIVIDSETEESKIEITPL